MLMVPIMYFKQCLYIDIVFFAIGLVDKCKKIRNFTC